MNDQMNDTITNPSDVSDAFDARLNAADVDGMLELIGPGAIARTPEGDVLQGTDTIKEMLGGWVSAGAQLQGKARPALISNDTALLLIDWTLQLTKAEGTPTKTGTATHVLVRARADAAWQMSVFNPGGVG